MATHSNIITSTIPWMEDPGRLQSMGLQRVRHYSTQACVCTFTHAHTHTHTHTPHSFFIHSSVDGYLSSFRILDIVNNSMNTGVHLFKLMFLFLSYMCLGMEYKLGHTVVIIFSVLRNLQLISAGTAPIYIPTNSVWRFPFLHNLANICYLCTFWW